MPYTFTGSSLYVPAGKRIIRNGVPARQARSTIVTVRDTAPARNGKTRVFWKSNGYKASALV
jgi:hypothetical protein